MVEINKILKNCFKTGNVFFCLPTLSPPFPRSFPDVCFQPLNSRAKDNEGAREYYPVPRNLYFQRFSAFLPGLAYRTVPVGSCLYCRPSSSALFSDCPSFPVLAVVVEFETDFFRQSHLRLILARSVFGISPVQLLVSENFSILRKSMVFDVDGERRKDTH